MRVLVIGSGGVGSAAATIAATRDFVTHLRLADADLKRAEGAADLARERGGDRFSAVALDAGKVEDITRQISEFGADLVLNACDPRLNPPIFQACYEARVTYLDMAMTLSVRHDQDPYGTVGRMLGDDQFAAAERWESAGVLALCGIGVEPGFSDVAARFAADHLLTEIDEVNVRDGANLVVDGYDFAPTFSIWTTNEECLNPPLIWERERGWRVTEPFSEPEVFDFPGGIGPVECVNVEHEEVVLVPQWVNCNRVTFKYGLGDEFIEVLRVLEKTGLASDEPVNVRGTRVSPRDVVAATLPDPRTLGSRMHGVTCAGTWVIGRDTDGYREYYIHHLADNQTCMREWGHQAVVWQTAINPVIAMELIASGTWNGAGVIGPEALDAVPFLQLLDEYGSPAEVLTRTEGEGEWLPAVPAWRTK